MQQLKGFMMVSFLILFSLPSHAQQIIQVLPTPPNPSECDSVQVAIQGNLPQNNSIQNTQIQQSGNSVEIILQYGQGGSPIPFPSFFENVGLAPLPQGQNQISVILKNSNGFNADNNSSTIQVSSLNLTSGFTIPRDTICERSMLPITDTSNGANQYQWLDNGSMFDSVASPTYQAVNPGPRTIQQVVVNGVCSDTMAKQLEVLISPEAEITTNTDTQQICENEVDTLTINNGYDYYKWQKDGSVIAGQNSSSLPVSEGGLYQVNTRTSKGCSDKDSLFVEETPTTTPSITKTDSLLASSPAKSYQWLLDGEPIDGATNSEYVAQESGKFKVVTFTENGCSDTSAPATITSTKTPLSTVNQELITYPSPAQDVIHYSLKTANQAQNLTISLHDLNGRVIWEQRLSSSSQEGTIAVDGLANGLYLLQLQTDNATITKKVVIE